MKKLFILLLIGIVSSGNLFAQEEDKTYKAVELVYMHAKSGKVDDFEKAVKSHNEKFHADGKYAAHMDKVLTGPNTGTYVWIMGPCMLSDLDNRPGKGKHDDDWTNNVEPHVKSYGAAEYWKMNEKQSYTPEGWEPAMFVLWVCDIKRGEYYRFKSLMEKVQKVYTKKGTHMMRVFDNMFGRNDGRDVTIVFGKDNWADIDNSWKLKPDFEKEFGEGTWQQLIEEWEEVVLSIDREVWEVVK